MAAQSKLPLFLRLAGVLVVLACVRPSGAVEAPKKGAPEPPKEIVIPKSQFVDDIKVGHDPFFPDSERRNPKPPKPVDKGSVKPPKPADPFAGLVLHGLSGKDGSRLAVIGTALRNYTFASGEEIAVKTPDGPVRLRCVEIRPTSVIVSISGQPGTKELNLPAAR